MKETTINTLIIHLLDEYIEGFDRQELVDQLSHMHDPAQVEDAICSLLKIEKIYCSGSIIKRKRAGVDEELNFSRIALY